MKLCTSIEQSKKLIELGISITTADMYWLNAKSEDYLQGLTPYVNDDTLDLAVDIPAWSLPALLTLFDDKAGLAKEYGTWFAYDNGKSHCCKHFDNPIDSAFEMVCWLKENGKI